MISFKKHFRFFAVLSLLFAALPSYAGGSVSSLFELLSGGFDLSKAKNHSEFLAMEQEMIAGKKFDLWGVALFSGSDLVSSIIKKVTHSKTSHIGILLKDELGEIYCMEATGSASQILKQHMAPRVQIDVFETVLNNYGGGVSTRQFIFEEGKRPDVQKVTDLVNKYLDAPYEKSFSSLLKSPSRSNKKEDTSSLFCSELAALFLKELGYLPSFLP